MVERQIAARGVRDPAVLAAMRRVPRHFFVPRDRRHAAYDDTPVPIGHQQTISQPYIVAYMLAALELHDDHRVLDVGCGSGYQTALLAKIARDVYAVERLEPLATAATNALAAAGIVGVAIAVRDGSAGWPEHAPYDRIICGAAAPEIPLPWIEQLADGGRIIAPIGGQHVQTLEVVEKRADSVTRTPLIDVRFVRLIGDHGW